MYSQHPFLADLWKYPKPSHVQLVQGKYQQVYWKDLYHTYAKPWKTSHKSCDKELTTIAFILLGKWGKVNKFIQKTNERSTV